MSNLSDIGNLMHLHRYKIQPGEGTDAAEFLITATAKTLNRFGGRNWVPVIVKEVGEDQYEVIGNSFMYAVAEKAGLEKVWCIIADSSEETVELTKVLSGEATPKINLSTATRDEIQVAFQYLIDKYKDFKGVKKLVAINRIEEDSSRLYWKTLDPIISFKCGITKGKKLKTLEEVFYLEPQPEPESEKKTPTWENLTVKELKDLAKKCGIPGYSKKKKTELITELVKSLNC